LGYPCPVDEPGWETKKLYVWFEAVIGYLSAPIEWAQVSGQKEAWRDWWTNPNAKQFHFIGKDNIFFHTSQWPAELWARAEQFMEIFAGEQNTAQIDCRTMCLPINS
jgi:methionyl-tRNA synthetase